MTDLETIRPEYRIAYDVAMTVLALIAVVLRIHVRYFYRSRKTQSKRRSVAYVVGDVFMVIGMIILISFAASDIWLQDMIIKAPLAASGRDITGWLVLRVAAAKILTYQYLVGALGLYAIKTSFLAYYFDAREGFARRLRITLYVCTGFIVANFCVIMGYLTGKCRPFEKYWKLTPDNCLIVTPLRDTIVVTGTHIATDITIMFMGFLVIRTLRFHTQMLPAVTFIFLLGVLTIIVNCLRCGISVRLIEQILTLNFILGNKAAEKLAEWATLITLAELSVALIAVSLPSLRVWWRAWVKEEQMRERRGAEVMLEMNVVPNKMDNLPGPSNRSPPSSPPPPQHSGVCDSDIHEVHTHDETKRDSTCTLCHTNSRMVERVREVGRTARSPIHGHFKKSSWSGSPTAEGPPMVFRPPPELAKFDFDFQRIP